MDIVVSGALEVVDLEGVMAILLHRDPMLFVDSVEVDTAGVKGTGHWYVRPDHPVFAGHYPEQPVFPGHLTAEMAAQVAGVVYAKTIGSDVKGVPMLTASSGRFSRPVRPGDLLEARVEVTQEGNVVRTIFVCVVNTDKEVASGEAEFVVVPPRVVRRRLGVALPDNG